MSLIFKKLSCNAYTPTKATKLSAGYDLYSPKTIEIPSDTKTVISTNLLVKLPDHCYGRIAARSGMCLSYVTAVEGVINENNNIDFPIVLYNFGKTPYIVQKGDRIAQIICQNIFHYDIDICYFNLLSDEAYMPVETTKSIFQLYNPFKLSIPKKTAIDINIHVEALIPSGYYGRITNNNYNINTNIIVLGNVVTNEDIITVRLYNLGDTDYVILKGENIAQIIYEEIISPTELSPLSCFKRVGPNAIFPAKNTAFGFNLYSPSTIIIPRKKVQLLYTDLQCILPQNENKCYGRIAALGDRHKSTMILGGVIDVDYKGNVGIILYNLSEEEDRIIERGEKIAYFICEKIIHPTLVDLQLRSSTDWRDKNNDDKIMIRGVDGFGSSGR